MRGFAEAEVLVPCGGGGLTSGIALALSEARPGWRVHPVEPEEFDDATRSLVSGKREENTRRDGSICDAIITPQRRRDHLSHTAHTLCGGHRRE